MSSNSLRSPKSDVDSLPPKITSKHNIGGMRRQTLIKNPFEEIENSTSLAEKLNESKKMAIKEFDDV